MATTYLNIKVVAEFVYYHMAKTFLHVIVTRMSRGNKVHFNTYGEGVSFKMGTGVAVVTCRGRCWSPRL